MSIKLISHKTHRTSLKIDLYSENRENSDDSASDCLFVINQPIEPYSNEEAIQIGIEHISIPHSFYLIETGVNDSFSLKSAGDLTYSEIVISAGNYDVYTLISEIEEKIGASASLGNATDYSVTYIKSTNLLQFYNSVVEFELVMNNDGAIEILGFPVGSYNSASQIILSQKPINLVGTDAIYITTDMPSSNTYSSKTGKMSHVIARVPINVPSNYLIEYENQTKFKSLLPNGMSLSSLRLRLTDKSGNIINLHGLNWSISMIIEFRSFTRSL